MTVLPSYYAKQVERFVGRARSGTLLIFYMTCVICSCRANDAPTISKYWIVGAVMPLRSAA
jgi:hypothetical protein